MPTPVEGRSSEINNKKPKLFNQMRYDKTDPFSFQRKNQFINTVPIQSKSPKPETELKQALNEDKETNYQA